MSETAPDARPLQGIAASLPDLLRTRPQRGRTGFAPAGAVLTHEWGVNRSVFLGRGMEFAESRVYQPGDDVKSIDWRVTARTGQAHTKLFQEERERTVLILLDTRAMMQFGTRTRFKANLACEVAAMLAWVGHDGGDRVGGLIMTRDGHRDFRAQRTRRSVLGFLEAMCEETRPERNSGQEIALAEALRRLRHLCRPGHLAFVISDFADLDPAAETELRHLAAKGHVTTIQVTDLLDAALPPGGGRISDGRSAMALAALSRRTLAEYHNQFKDRQARLEDLCRKHRMVCHFLQTQDDPARILHPQINRRLAA